MGEMEREGWIQDTQWRNYQISWRLGSGGSERGWMTRWMEEDWERTKIRRRIELVSSNHTTQA